MQLEIPSNITWNDVAMNGRGTVGETILHLCFLLNTPPHQRLIKILVPWFGNHGKHRLYRDENSNPYLDVPYSGPLYEGEVRVDISSCCELSDRCRCVCTLRSCTMSLNKCSCSLRMVRAAKNHAHAGHSSMVPSTRAVLPMPVHMSMHVAMRMSLPTSACLYL